MSADRAAIHVRCAKVLELTRDFRGAALEYICAADGFARAGLHADAENCWRQASVCCERRADVESALREPAPTQGRGVA